MTDNSILHRLIHHPAAAWIALLASLVLTGMAWHISERAIHANAMNRFLSQANDIAKAVANRLAVYETGLRGGAGLYNASDFVSRAEWRQYVSDIGLPENYPGIQGIGFSQMIHPAELKQHVATIRAEGFPEYSVKPSGEREIYSAIIYLEPFDWRNQRALGYDMFSEAVRRDAMERARDSGQPAVSGRVILVQETKEDVQYGFLMYLPLYRKNIPITTVEERRAAHLGFVYSPFRAKDFMQGILGSAHEMIGIELYDGEHPSKETLLYSSAKDESLHALAAEGSHTFGSFITLPLKQRTWSIYVHAHKGYLSSSEAVQPMVVAFCGIVIDLLLFIILVSVRQQKQKIESEAQRLASKAIEGEKLLKLALKRAEDANLAKKQSEHDLRSILDNLPSMIGYWDKNLRNRFGNHAYQTWFGIDPSKMPGMHIREVIGEERYRLNLPYIEAVLRGEPQLFERAIPSPDGKATRYSLAHYIPDIHNGEVQGFFVLVSDITAIKQAEAELERAKEAAEAAEVRYRTVADYTYGWETWNDTASRLLYCSPSCKRISGHTAESFIANTHLFLDIIHPDDRDRVQEHMGSTCHPSGRFEEQVFRIVRPDGSMAWIEHVCQPVFDDGGNFIGHRASNRDITERKQAEDAQKALSTTFSNLTGKAFFEGVARHIGTTLGVDWVFIGRLADTGDCIRVLGGYARGETMKEFSYSLGGTPCANVVGKEYCSYQENIQALFPEDISLKEMGAEGYAGIPLFDSQHNPIGIMVAIHSKPLPVTHAKKEFFEVFAERVAIEIQRWEAEQKLHELNLELKRRIQERTAALAAADNARNKLETVIENIPAIFFTKDAEGRYEIVNRLYTQGTSTIEADVIGRTDAEIFTADVASAIYKVDQRVFKEGVAITSEECIPHPDGTMHDYLTTKAPLLDSEGKPYALIGMAVDITKQKAIERALKVSEASFRQLVISSPLPTLITTSHPEGRILTMNERFTEVFGYTIDDVRDITTWWQRAYPDLSYRTEVQASWFAAIKAMVTAGAQHIQPMEVEVTCKDGSMRHVSVHLTELPDRAMVVFNDLTKHKQMEDILHRAKEAAETAVRIKSEFLANMSHEIRTPLNAVLGMAQIGLRDSQENKSANCFREILNSGSHLLSVINDILDFSKIEAGKFKVEKRPFALLSVIDSVKSFVTSHAGEKRLTLSVSLAPDLPKWVEGDALRLTQILTNLLSNAVKFTEHGEVMLRIARDGDIVHFMVADSGIGMNEEQLGRLFHPFEQADSSATRTYGGTGLGLAISIELAHMMGGDISVDSRPGKGSSFYLQLPLPPVAIPAQPVRQAAPSGTAGSRLKGVSVLVAEDMEVNCLVLEEILTHEGAYVIFARNGQEALNLLDEKGVNAFDVVLMDVQMPVMDGLEATRRITSITPALPVIGLTAHALAGDRDKCLAAGMVDHVTKPVDIDALVTSIRRHLGMQVMPTAPVKAEAAIDSLFVACNDPDIIDLSILARSVGKNPANVAKIVALFVKTTRDTLAEMRAALTAGDLSELGRLGHRLKSTARTVGAMRFGALCQELEKFKADGEIDVAREKVDQLHTLFEQIAQCVREN